MWTLSVVLVLTTALAGRRTYADQTPGPCDGGSCYPDIGDLLVGREDNLTATSTCGHNGPEKFCILSNLDDTEDCYICDARSPAENHDVRNVITTFRHRLTSWWQSENGVEDVSLRLDLETAFHFTHLIMTFKTFRPAAMLIERSNDYGKTWRVYRYFAYDCNEFFPGYRQFPPHRIDEVICDSRYSMIEPSNKGEVIYKVLEPSLIPLDDPYSARIQDLLTITNLRINFTHMHTLGDDLLDTRENIKEKYYYSLYELIVRGNCFCYGHADECRPIDASLERPDLGGIQVNGKCVCQHNTQGLNCNECLPFYRDHPWRPADRRQPNECKLCNCNNHADECHFDEAVWEATGHTSGGVCENCRHNTMGRNCELCKPFFYQHPERDIRDPYVCQECDCEVAGSLNGGLCDGRTDSDLGMIAGQCRCKVYVDGKRCDQCRAGYYNLQESNPDGCTACDCDQLGTLEGTGGCDAATGQCICKRHTTGRRCDQCKPQTWGLSADSNGCKACNCDVGGAYDNDCNPTTGQCNCRPHMTGRRCDTAEDGYFVPLLDHYLFEGEDANGNENTNRYNQKYNPPMMWTGYGFRMVHSNGVIEFTVSGLPASMDYDFILRYVPYTEKALDNVRVSIIRPNAGNIPAGSPCDNTKPGDDEWTASLRGHPVSFENLGSHCLEMEYDYIVRFEFPDGMDSIGIDSLVLVANYSGISMFHGSVEGVQRSREFDELKCQDNAMQLPKHPQNDICASLVLSMNAILHDGALYCDCDPQGSESAICDKSGGQCVCKPNVMGRRCDQCVPGTFDLGPDGCKPCDCNTNGSFVPDIQYCDTQTGQCTCINNGIGGQKCDRCKPGFYSYPECRACNCNGHTQTCDPVTGTCINCQEHTIGDNCEECEDGYYGDPTLGSQDQCKPCMCPGGPESGRQFAQTCGETYNPLVNAYQVICECLPQYTGETCNQCAPGHYGNPDEYGGQCIACDCNRNINTSDPNACDAQTGECTGCLYDTAGYNCELCRDYYYGSAIARTCRSCDCDVSGTDPTRCEPDGCHCDAVTGQCQCLPNMTGRRCESCLPNHFRAPTGDGCISCDCHPLNSIGASCNEFDGQCACKAGFGGRTCSDCADGFWGNPNVACRECNCDILGSADLQCDRLTGECVCRDGIGGRYCDRCERGFTGEIPYCEPCGECFDNWDKIITDLKNKTTAAMSRAQAIEETGITGAYENDFAEIKKILKDINDILDALDADSAGDNFRDSINNLRDRLTTQEHRLNKLENDMTQLQLEDDNIAEWLDARQETLKQVQGHLEELKEDKKNISKASPAAAYKQVEDAAERSLAAEKEAQAATIEEGSLVKQSQKMRAEAELQYAEKLSEFGDKSFQVEQNLASNKQNVDALSLADLNKNVCGAATEGCDDTCGGAGCDQCGGISCEGAVTVSEEAMLRAEKTQQILETLTNEANELQLRIQDTKDDAADAKVAAEKARKDADEIEVKIKARNQKIRDLILEIKQFLTEERAKPEEIETLAREVLAMSLTADREEIDEHVQSINNLVNSLPDVDIILGETQDDLDQAQALLDDAKKAQARAAAVSGDVKAVLQALEEAENASRLAEAASEKAYHDIDLATNNINEIARKVTIISTDVDEVSSAISDMGQKMSRIERTIVGNKLNAEVAVTEANMAKETAQAAKDELDRRSFNTSAATAEINRKKAQVDRLRSLKDNASNLQKNLTNNMKELDALQKKFEDQETDLNKKNAELETLLREVEALYASISEKEKKIRRC